MPTAAEAVAWKEGPMRFGTFLLIGLVALGGTSCASAPSAPAGVDVSGKWQGPWQYQNASLGGSQVTKLDRRRLRLEQDREGGICLSQSCGKKPLV